MEESKTEIKSYSKSEMVQLYGTTKFTFNAWIKRAKLDEKITEYWTLKVFTPKQVELIFDTLGYP